MYISKEVNEILKILNKNNKAYIIGGAVRNYLINFPYYDYDIATNATPFQISKLLNSYNIDTTFSKYGNIKINKNVDITSFRIESDFFQSGKPSCIEFVKKIEQDVYRRDFTINSITYNPDEGYKFYFTAYDDIKEKKLKFIGDPHNRIKEDHSRMLRALRLSSEYNLSIHDYKTILNNISDINKISRSKIYDEIFKFLNSNFIISSYEKYFEAYDYIFNYIFDIKNFSMKEIMFLNDLPRTKEIRIVALAYIYNKNIDFINEIYISRKSKNLIKKIYSELHMKSQMKNNNNISNLIQENIKYHYKNIRF